MHVTVLFFAQARERAGSHRVALELPDGSRVADALDAVRRAHPGIAELETHLAIAVDGQLARGDSALQEGSELALLPPVSGG